MSLKLGNASKSKTYTVLVKNNPAAATFASCDIVTTGVNFIKPII